MVSFMGKRKTIFPLAVMEKIIKKIDGNVRVSEEAKEEFERILKDYAIKIGEKAIMNAKHAGRITVKKEDLNLAVR